MPGKMDGEAMDEENYLSLPGRPIVTSETYLGEDSSSSSAS